MKWFKVWKLINKCNCTATQCDCSIWSYITCDDLDRNDKEKETKMKTIILMVWTLGNWWCYFKCFEEENVRVQLIICNSLNNNRNIEAHAQNVYLTWRINSFFSPSPLMVVHLVFQFRQNVACYHLASQTETFRPIRLHKSRLSLLISERAPPTAVPDRRRVASNGETKQRKNGAE